VGRVTRIVITIGELAAVQKECLEFAFEVITKGTPMEGAVLAIEYIKPLFRCRECGAEFEPSDGFFSPCPACGAFGVDVLKGDGMYVKSVELEEERGEGSRGET
jgi:hydrogenase nickel incorporation protein HypA/HybF